ncbi:MAG: sugar phosphate isomerase/epimerase [Chloroflexota bacterium]|nr:sugar phosphate isomerase/epimerase [Chloroflexota bacterium]
MSNMKPVALQLYSLRDALAKDFEGIVRSVAAMGYVGVEPYGGMPAGLREAADLFEELELEVCSSHVPFPDRAKLESALAEAEAFDLSRLVVAFLPQAEFETLDAVKRVCERLNRASETMQASKVQLGYHNHWWEFKDLDGQATLDVMLSELDDEVFLEIDTYWAQVGGLDAVEVVKRAGGRAPLIHLKDGSLSLDDNMTAVGAGKMSVPEIVEAAAETAEWHIVEIDRCDGDMLQAVHDSYKYLTSNSLVRGKV